MANPSYSISINPLEGVSLTIDNGGNSDYQFRIFGRKKKAADASSNPPTFSSTDSEFDPSSWHSLSYSSIDLSYYWSELQEGGSYVVNVQYKVNGSTSGGESIGAKTLDIIYFNYNGGTVLPNEKRQVILYDINDGADTGDGKVPINKIADFELSATGYAFLNQWTVEGPVAGKYGSSSSNTDGWPVGDYTLTALWSELDGFVIQYYVDKVLWETSDPYYDNGDGEALFTIINKKPEKDNYIFQHWLLNEDESNGIYTSGSAHVFPTGPSAYNMYAVFSEVAKGGTVYIQDQKYTPYIFLELNGVKDWYPVVPHVYRNNTWEKTI